VSYASELGQLSGTATLEKRSYRMVTLLELLTRAASKYKAALAAKAVVKPVRSKVKSLVSSLPADNKWVKLLKPVSKPEPIGSLSAGNKWTTAPAPSGDSHFSFLNSPGMVGSGRYKPGVATGWPPAPNNPRLKFFQDLRKWER
jgi:hypothetical protein